jgi:hypothetical protein
MGEDRLKGNSGSIKVEEESGFHIRGLLRLSRFECFTNV